MSKYKNTIIIAIALVMFAYSGFIAILPKILENSFNIDKFEDKMFQATSLLTRVDSVQYDVKPSLETTIKLRNVSFKYIDEQPLFEAAYIEAVAGPSILFGKNFNLKNVKMRHVWYADQILPDGENKIAFLPGAFNSELFGAKNITVVPSDIKVRNLKITQVTPNNYKERRFREKTFTKTEVTNFLKSLNFSHVKIK